MLMVSQVNNNQTEVPPQVAKELDLAKEKYKNNLLTQSEFHGYLREQRPMFILVILQITNNPFKVPHVLRQMFAEFQGVVAEEIPAEVLPKRGIQHHINFVPGAVNPNKVEAIVSWSTIATLHNTRRFHGLASFYQRFVKGFNIFTTPIAECLKSGSSQWNSKTQKTFEPMKRKMTEAPIHPCIP